MKEKFFTVDKIGGEYPLFGEEIRRGAPTAVFGVSDSLKYLLASLVDAPVVYIAADAVAAQKAAENIASLAPPCWRQRTRCSYTARPFPRIPFSKG